MRCEICGKEIVGDEKIKLEGLCKSCYDKGVKDGLWPAEYDKYMIQNEGGIR